MPTGDRVEKLLNLLSQGPAAAKKAGFRLQDFSRAFAGPEAPKSAKARTRRRLLAAAAELFEKLGYRQTSMDAVALQAGVAKGTVYVHFKNKSDLLYQVVLEEKQRIGARFAGLFAEPLAPAERLRRYLELALLSTRDSPLIARLLQGDRDLQIRLDEMPASARGRLQHAQDAGVQLLLEGVGRFDALSAAERSERAKVLLALLLMAGHLMEPSARQGMSPERFAAQLAKVLVGGIGAR